MKALILTAVVAFLLIGGCGPVCPKGTYLTCVPKNQTVSCADTVVVKRPQCSNMEKAIEREKRSQMNIRIWKSFQIWVSAWGANPYCGNFFIYAQDPSKIGVVCRFPNRTMTFIHPIPVYSDTTHFARCKPNKFTPKAVISYGIKFGIWAKKAAMLKLLMVKYKDGLPYLCTRDKRQAKCVLFPLPEKRKKCLMKAHQEAEKRRRLVAPPY
jgi:hypothetical protein